MSDHNREIEKFRAKIRYHRGIANSDTLPEEKLIKARKMLAKYREKEQTYLREYDRRVQQQQQQHQHQ